jgi:hypothetical protein
MTKAKPKNNKGNKKAEDYRKASPASPSNNNNEEPNTEGRAKMMEGTGSPPLNRSLRNRIFSEKLDNETARKLEIEIVTVSKQLTKQLMELTATDNLHRWCQQTEIISRLKMSELSEQASCMHIFSQNSFESNIEVPSLYTTGFVQNKLDTDGKIQFRQFESIVHPAFGEGISKAKDYLQTNNKVT